MTHDGAATWTSRVLPPGLPAGQLTDADCLPTYTPIAGRAALCRLGGIQGTNPFGTANSVFRSTDGGKGWVQVGADWTASVLSVLACVSADSCYAVGGRGTVARVSGGSALSAERGATTNDLYGLHQGTILVRRQGGWEEAAGGRLTQARRSALATP